MENSKGCNTDSENDMGENKVEEGVMSNEGQSKESMFNQMKIRLQEKTKFVWQFGCKIKSDVGANKQCKMELINQIQEMGVRLDKRIKEVSMEFDDKLQVGNKLMNYGFQGGNK